MKSDLELKLPLQETRSLIASLSTQLCLILHAWALRASSIIGAHEKQTVRRSHELPLLMFTAPIGTVNVVVTK